MIRTLDRFAVFPCFLPEDVSSLMILAPLTVERRMLPMKRSRKKVNDALTAIACQGDVGLIAARPRVEPASSIDCLFV